jgi:hypothetical protein
MISTAVLVVAILRLASMLVVANGLNDEQALADVHLLQASDWWMHNDRW